MPIAKPNDLANNSQPQTSLLDVDSHQLNLTVDPDDADMQLLKNHRQSVAGSREGDRS
jgi:hypothetical protein